MIAPWVERWGPVATPLLWSHAMYLIMEEACARMIELLPAKATFAPGEPIEIEVRGEHDRLALGLWHLDRLVAEVEVADGDSHAAFPPQPEGGYGVECRRCSYGRRCARRSARAAPATASSPTTRPAATSTASPRTFAVCT